MRPSPRLPTLPPRAPIPPYGIGSSRRCARAQQRHEQRQMRASRPVMGGGAVHQTRGSSQGRSNRPDHSPHSTSPRPRARASASTA
ncbi:MAG: hypothetical protein ACK559_37890, partial [bacterium]